MQKLIIIGASSGIGLELVNLYIKNGDIVGITGRRTELLEEIANQFPSQVFAKCFDVRDGQNILHLESLIKKMGGLDLLIYNSGFGEPGKTLDWEIDKQTVQTNVNGFVEIVTISTKPF